MAGELTLEPGHVHVWRTSVTLGQARLVELTGTLALDELSRARRFVFDKDRERYIASRGLLRALLGRYTGADPQGIEFAYGPQGKPALRRPACGLQFNVSHSGTMALFAFSASLELGIDIEKIRPPPTDMGIARARFSALEFAALQRVPVDLRPEAFFHCWTRKEAFVKAVGGGLPFGLDRFDVTLDPGKPVALLNCRWDPLEAGRWSLIDMNPAPGYAGALAVKDAGIRVSRFNL